MDAGHPSYHREVHRARKPPSLVHHIVCESESYGDEDEPMDLTVKKPSNSSQCPSILDYSRSILFNELTNPYSLLNYYYTINRSSSSSVSSAPRIASEDEQFSGNFIPKKVHHHSHHLHHLPANYASEETSALLHHGLRNNFTPVKTSSSSVSSVDSVYRKTELRSADTTNFLDLQEDKKRVSRPLTGRHVRPGTGSSPATLLVLKKWLHERQRLRALGLPLPTSAKAKRAPRKRK
ncbi:hypothetical protein HDE_00802 [Halotydeus destructor]|nr:hypothetical protein HDE_00802 [Halotydeus destructor]